MGAPTHPGVGLPGTPGRIENRDLWPNGGHKWGKTGLDALGIHGKSLQIKIKPSSQKSRTQTIWRAISPFDFAGVFVLVDQTSDLGS